MAHIVSSIHQNPPVHNVLGPSFSGAFLLALFTFPISARSESHSGKGHTLLMEGEMENFNAVEEVVPVELENEIGVLDEGRCQVDLYAIEGKVDQGLEVNKEAMEKHTHSTVVGGLGVLLGGRNDMVPRSPFPGGERRHEYGTRS